MKTKFTEIANRITKIKSDLANAISLKGVITTSDDTFSTIVKNIGNIASNTEEWIKPYDWPDIEAEPLEDGEIRILMCDLFGANNNSIYFYRRNGATSIKATIDWGDGNELEKINIEGVEGGVTHTFIDNGTPCDRGYNTYVVRIKFDEPQSAPNRMYFYREGATATELLYSNPLWIYGDMRYFTTLTNLMCDPNLYSPCSVLERANLINTNNANSMSAMFRNCYSLKSIPQLDTSKVSIASAMFSSCYSLEHLPQMDFSKVTSMHSMFTSCYSLKEIPQMDFSKVSNLFYAFSNCYSLESIPELNTSNIVALTSVFNGCLKLKKSPKLDTRKVANMSNNNNHFSNCYSLEEIDTITLSKDISLSVGSVLYKPPLTKIDIAYDETDIPLFTQTVPIRINYTQLSSDELNKLMEQLPDGNGKTLDIKCNRGSLECDPSIATAKNWTVLVK